MYLQPYGDEQQLNLNWIINEIINLHKQLDPDYETPSFTQIYPYSNLNRLNLDWVLSELKALKELAPEPSPEIDIQAVAEALVALPFDSTKSYQIYDFISKDGEIWRATEAIAAGGEWDSTKWFKTKLGTDLAVLERWINAINNSLTTLQNTVADLSSDDISDDSDAGGATVKASLNNLKGSLNDINSAFVGKKIVLLGDSNAVLWANTNPFANESVDSFTSYAVGGATFNETNSVNLATQYTNFANSGITPDYIIIWCGGNDMAFAPDYGIPLLGDYSRPTATNTFAGMRKLLYDIRTNYPTAKIYGITRTDVSSYPDERNNYVFGMIERIYTAWNVPIISLDGVANITEEISASQQAFMTLESGHYRHYNSAGLARITEIILCVMRGALNSHKAREIEVIFCPSTITTQADAVAWVQTQLLKGYGQLNLYFAQKGYKVYYNMGQNTTNIVILSPAVTLASADSKLYYNDSTNLAGFNLHELPIAADSTQALASLDELPTGFLSVRINQITSATSGVPSEILADLNKAPWQFQGCWQSNGYYKGVCYMPSNTQVFQPSTAKRFMLVFRAVSGDHANWVFSDIDMTNSWTGANVPL